MWSFMKPGVQQASDEVIEPGENIVAGARVVVDGLKARPELNGKLATVKSHNNENGRWNVLIDDMRDEMALKLEALTLDEATRGLIVGTRVRIADVEKKPELNGKLGTVQVPCVQLCRPK